MVSKEKIKKFPDSAGVYLMKDKESRVIYVGKAVSLKKRLLSYFLRQDSIKTQVMLSGVHRVDFIKTSSEHDALVLESKLIKEYKPHFNIVLKDDKSFPYIKITNEDFPRVFIGRKRRAEKGVDYFGPYTSSKLLRQALDILRRGFRFRSCRNFPKKACLNYHIGLCSAPCIRNISKKKYQAVIRKLQEFLTKRDPELIAELSIRLRSLVKSEKFEKAAELRDQLQALSLLVSLKKKLSKEILSDDADFKKIGIKKEPLRIEAFDISNIGGDSAVGSMVSFYKGKPDKNQYRRFKIKWVQAIDDYAMIKEVVKRRYTRLNSQGLKFPDLIIIDGGLGHLKAARSVLSKEKFDIPVISIAKNEELIYTVENKSPVKLDRASGVLRLIQRARDEAHRFAQKYHHLLRKKNVFK